MLALTVEPLLSLHRDSIISADQVAEDHVLRNHERE
jgi:hypothetical protein